MRLDAPCVGVEHGSKRQGLMLSKQLFQLFNIFLVNFNLDLTL